MSEKKKEKAAELKIKLLVKHIKKELDSDVTLTNKQRADILIEKMREFQEDVKKEGVTLQKGDLKPFSSQLIKYIALHKKEKEEEEAKAKAAKEKAKKARRKTRKITHRLAREGVEILRRRDEAAAAAASAKGDDEEEIIFGAAAARGPPPGFTFADKGNPRFGGKRKTRKKRRKRKKSRKTKKRRRKRKTRKKRGRGKVTKQTQKKKQKPGILKSKIPNPFKKPRRVTFRPPGRSKLRIEHNAKAMMESAIDETQQEQGAQKTEPLSTFTEDLNRALPYTPPPMPTFEERDSGSDEELANITAAAKK